MLFYFTATGNSLYVAKQLEADPLSIPQVMKQGCQNFQADSIGVVCPIYGHEIPLIVRKFLKDNVFQTPYFYMILTYGNRHGGAAGLTQRYCRDCGIEPAYIRTFLTVDNFLPGFDMAEQMKMDKNEDDQLAVIRQELAAHTRWVEAPSEADKKLHQAFAAMSDVPIEKRWQDIYRVTGHCVGCGICAKVCPVGRIQVRQGKAVYDYASQRECQQCMACIHACPQKAITMTMGEPNPQARYRNPHISLSELIQANEQDAEEKMQGPFLFDV